jgi:membrane protein YqaA with SNARE-associated domain
MWSLFLFAFFSNVAMAVVPHEPAVIAAAPDLGIWLTAAVASLGTLLACVVDYCLLLPRVSSLSRRAVNLFPWVRRAFERHPFGILLLSGITPLPFWPFKVLAFGSGYPTLRYLLAVSVGRFPRYLLLAYLGWSIPLTSPVLWIALALILLIPLCGRWLTRKKPDAQAIRRPPWKRTEQPASPRA